jgi:hypothetical protein
MNQKTALCIAIVIMTLQFFFLLQCMQNNPVSIRKGQHEQPQVPETIEIVKSHTLPRQETLGSIPERRVTLKPHMTHLEWKSFVVDQLHATSNFSAAMYARWSRYLNKEWINDEYKSTTPKAMEWDTCMNGAHYCVISLGLYAHDVNYLNWIKSRIGHYRDAMDIFFPGWRLRIYHDESVPFSVLEGVAARGVETILVSNFKGHIAGMFWRFFVADDLNVDRYIVRDLDSDFTWRERSAVDEWIRSNKSYHSMADAESHNVPIMGGMWGGMPKRPLPFSMQNSAPEFMRLTAYKGGDQDFLAHLMWPAWQKSGSVFTLRAAAAEKSVPPFHLRSPHSYRAQGLHEARHVAGL